VRLLLDTAVVGEICHPRKYDDVRAWFARAAAAHEMLLSEVADYELRRELLRIDSRLRPDEVVAHSVLSADTVEYLWRTWARLRGLVPVSPEGIRALREAVYSSRPLTTGAEVVTAVQRFAERPVRLCTRCKSGCPEYCCVCPAREAHRAARTSSTR
jgi:hypothetical protein